MDFACKLCGQKYPHTTNVPGHPDLPAVPDDLQTLTQKDAFTFQPWLGDFRGNFLACTNWTECGKHRNPPVDLDKNKT